jgi:hypothetical protein
VKVDIYRSGTYICRVVGNPQLGLIGSNRHLLYGNRRLDSRTIIVVDQWNMITYGYEMKRDVMPNEVIDLDQVQIGY